MTVGELISKLREQEPEREVMLSLATEDNDDVLDAPALDVYLQAGYVFVSGAE